MRSGAAVGVSRSRTEPRAVPSFGTLVDAARWRAAHQPERLAYRFLPSGEPPDAILTYGELDRRARIVASLLQAGGRCQERVLVVCPPGLEFVVAYFGCLYAGAVAVVLPPPVQSRLPLFLARLAGVCRDATPAVALTTARTFDMLRPHLVPAQDPVPLRWLAVDDLPDADPSNWRDPEASGSDLAFLQYTSGSTTEPKGVMVSHGNLIANIRAIERSFAQPPETESVCWLPPHHDMGLIGGILAPLYLGTAATLMPSVAFVQRPARWLQAIARYGASASGGPNFAYDLCLRRVTPEQCSALDLHTWVVAFTGAEPVRAETLRAFAERFGPCGFRPAAFKPCYGLAEATLLVAAAPGRAAPTVRRFRADELARHRAVPAVEDDAAGATLVSSGRPTAPVAIVNPESGTACDPGQVGEIWVSGPSVALGYWNRPEESAATFGQTLAGRGEAFLRTGDLGFLLDDELFVTGRIKDLIIIDGANHYPQDLERTVASCHPALGPEACAAFSIEVAGREELVVVVSPARRAETAVGELQRAIRHAITAHHDLRAHDVVLVKAGGIPRTTSGKIRRSACRRGYLAGTLDLWSQE
jgi:acyl-CoA synthetase (AMP-forming)/AMP-acid ligase II